MMDDELRKLVGYMLKCWMYGQPLMGVDWTRRENERYLREADRLIEVIRAAPSAPAPSPQGHQGHASGEDSGEATGA